MKAKNYSIGKGIKPVSRLPDWLIKVIGRFDSRKAPDVAIAHLNKYLSKLAKNEKDEALLAEAALKPSRAAGSRHLHVVIHNDPGAEPVPNTSDTSPAAQRAYSAALAKHKAETTAVTEAKEALLKVDSEIVSGNLVFEERLTKTRNKAMSQINAYIKGVRSGRRATFTPEINPDDTARIKYYNAHKETDDLIHQYAKEEKII